MTASKRSLRLQSPEVRFSPGVAQSLAVDRLRTLPPQPARESAPRIQEAQSIQATIEERLERASELAKSLPRFPSSQELVRLLRQGRGPEVGLLTDARGLSSTFYRLRLALFKTQYNEHQVAALAVGHLRSWTRLRITLDAEKLPAIPYIRCQVETFGGRPFLNAMSSAAAQARFAKWLDGRLDSVCLYRENGLAALQELESIPRADAVLLREIKAGMVHVAYVQRLCGNPDEELVAWLERSALPGGYLLTVPSVRAEFDAGRMEPAVAERMNLALRLAR